MQCHLVINNHTLKSAPVQTDIHANYASQNIHLRVHFIRSPTLARLTLKISHTTMSFTFEKLAVITQDTLVHVDAETALYNPHQHF